MAVPSERQCEYELITKMLRKYELSNRALIAKEQQVRQKLQTTRAMLGPRSCPAEDEVRCPHSCCRPPPPISEEDVSSTCVCDTDTEQDLLASCRPCQYSPPIPASDISIDVSGSEASSLGSLQGDDLAYLQQMAAISHDERARLARMERLKQRERDIMRTAQVTRNVVDQLSAIFDECPCAGTPATTSAPPPTPPPPPAQPPPDTTTTPPSTPELVESQQDSVTSSALSQWAATVAQTEKEDFTQHPAPLGKTPSTLLTPEGESSLCAAVYPPTKTETRLAHNDDPFRVASKVSRLPELSDILESPVHSLVDPDAELQIITDVLAGQKISRENASLVSQNLTDTKRRLSFMMQHSQECPQCQDTIQDSLKNIDEQLNVLTDEFRQTHYETPGGFPKTVGP